MIATHELLPLVLTLQKWKHYILSQDLVTKTDHCSLKYLLNQKTTSAEQQCLLMKLMPFDFTIVYKAGNENKGADVLSHRPQPDLLTLAMPVSLDLSTLREALEADPYTKQLLNQLSADPSSHSDFSLSASHLYANPGW